MSAPAAAATAEDARAPAATGAAVLAVWLDDAETGAVFFKLRGRKGARWGRARSLAEACRAADALEPPPRAIDFVGRGSR